MLRHSFTLRKTASSFIGHWSVHHPSPLLQAFLGCGTWLVITAHAGAFDICLSETWTELAYEPWCSPRVWLLGHFYSIYTCFCMFKSYRPMEYLTTAMQMILRFILLFHQMTMAKTLLPGSAKMSYKRWEVQTFCFSKVIRSKEQVFHLYFSWTLISVIAVILLQTNKQ